jgi:exopolyphosphatase/guanosine-5'-triphosphate,3'-diphosphate pyrophosphatase
MRVGVADVGSNSLHLQLIDGVPGGPPLPVFGAKWPIGLAERVGDDGAVDDGAVDSAIEALREVQITALAHQAVELVVFATSAVREATNGSRLCQEAKRQLGLDVTVLGGQEEAEFTFLATRRWLGWQAGPILMLDVGGGSFEIAYGRNEHPELAVSLPLGAGRLTRAFPNSDPPRPAEVRAVKAHAREVIDEVADRLRWVGPAAQVVGTSSTFRRLARLTGGPPRRAGPFVSRQVRHRALRRLIPELASMRIGQRSKLKGVSESRAPQILAGAIVAEAAMSAFEVKTLRVSPWALREGILLQRLDKLRGSASMRATKLVEEATQSIGTNRPKARRRLPDLASLAHHSVEASDGDSR